MKKRYLQHIIQSHPTTDGAGVKIDRVTMFDQPLTDPFLLLDEFQSETESDYIAGFPSHPHRGMETLSYLLHGSLEHQDHLGNKGIIHSGGAQWMSAGRGIIHSEMPARELDKLHGFQLWINLAATEKMQAPDYRDVQANEIPEIALKGTKIRAIAGHWQIENKEIKGPLNKLSAETSILDIQLEAGASLTISTKAHQRVLAKLYDGKLSTKPLAPEKSVLVFSEGDELVLSTEHGASLLLLSGTPIKEKVVHYGPFVMNSYEEIEQAIADYNSGKLGE